MFRISILVFRISRFCPPSPETSVNQKRVSMQNEPNFMKNRTNVTYDKSNRYENAPLIFGPKIPNPISPSVQMNLSPYISMNYEPRTTNYHGKNKAKTKPIQTQFKLEAKRRSLWVSFSEFSSQGSIQTQPALSVVEGSILSLSNGTNPI